MSIIEEIVAERRRQIEIEGWTTGHDDNHKTGELLQAGACYALIAMMSDDAKATHVSMLYGAHPGTSSIIKDLWPWDAHWFKPKDPRRDLIRAGALIVAEIERLDRQAKP